MGELRAIVVKLAGEQARTMTDHEIHTLGVGYASVQGLASKLLTKALDHKHATIIKRFSAFKTEEEIRNAWKRARQECAVEGAFWAIATHPLASETLFNEVFGHIHMLSHLVGASNRADLKRLVELEQDKEASSRELNSIRTETRKGWASRDKELQQLRSLLAKPASTESVQLEKPEISVFKKTIRSLEAQLSSQQGRQKATAGKLNDVQQQLDELSSRLERANTELNALKSEVTELEGYLETDRTIHSDLSGKTVLYVGGVARSIKFIRSCVEKSGAHFVHHDGGKEQATILLRGLIGRADLIMFPVDYVSHEAAHICKTIAQQMSKPCFPLPHAGAGSVIRVLSDFDNLLRN
jgi:hypothetical protein